MPLHKLSNQRRPKQTLVLLYWTLFACFALSFIFSHPVFSQIATEPHSSEFKKEDFHPGVMRIDFSITSQSPTHWEGLIRLSRGSFSGLTPLGSSVTSGTDFSFSDSSHNSLSAHTKAPVFFTGVETTIIAPLDSQLEIELINRTTNKRYQKNVFINRLLGSSTTIQLEDGCIIEIVRAPADELPIFVKKIDANSRYKSPSLFLPNENFGLVVIPRSFSTKVNSSLTLVASARKNDSNTPFWTESCDINLTQIQQNDEQASLSNGKFVSCNFTLQAPQQAGVFDVYLELYTKSSPTNLLRQLPPSRETHDDKLIARRIIQGVVVPASTSSQDATYHDNTNVEINEKLLLIIDPTNPNWHKTLSKQTTSSFHNSASATQQKTFLRSTFASNNVSWDHSSPHSLYSSIDSLTAPTQTYLSSLPDEILSTTNSDIAKEQTVISSVAPSDHNVVLGQVPANSHTTNTFPFRINSLFNFSGKDANYETIHYEINFIRQWERDKFETFQRNLDRQTWSIASNLWEKTISSGSSRLFQNNELKKYAPPQSRFILLEPNGSTPTTKIENKSLNILTEGGFSYSPISWEAYPIPIQEPGKPHVLKIEYPATFPQKLGISIFERNVSGVLMPTVLNAGIVVRDDPLSDNRSPRLAHYKLLFWPQTQTPIVLLSNCSSEMPAAYGKIRIYSEDESFTESISRGRGRVLGVALTEPNLCRQFSAPLKPSFFGISGVEDWKSFDSAISRLLYYLSISNFDVAMLSAIANGSTLYPSSRINSSTKYDGGVFLPSGNDFLKKDVLTLALAKFETQRKSLIPIVKLNTTLPLLEQRLQQLYLQSPDIRAAIEGIEWIGVDYNVLTGTERNRSNENAKLPIEAKRLITSRQNVNGSGPYYNILHPIVEEEVLKIIEELVSHCASYHSFGGLALDIGTDGWLVLPDEIYYGMDDKTFGRFISESRILNSLNRQLVHQITQLLVSKDSERYIQRADFVRNVCNDEWLEWRTNALQNFYRKVREKVSMKRSDLRLYLIGSHALESPICQSLLQPTLFNDQRVASAFRLIGIDPRKYATFPKQETSRRAITQVAFIPEADVSESYDSSIVLLRPEFVASVSSFAQTAVSDQLASPEASSLFSAGHSFPGVVFIHQSERKNLYDFNILSPCHPTIAEINTLALPAGYDNLRRFAHALAFNDMLCIFDGGDLIPFGQEESLHDWINVFKSLPAFPFKTWEPQSEAIKSALNDTKEKSGLPLSSDNNNKTIQPLVARYYHNSRETWIYLINTAPFHLGARLSVSCQNRTPFKLFANNKHNDPIQVGNELVWTLNVSPYELTAIQIKDSQATIKTIEVTRPSEICGIDGRLSIAVQNFISRLIIAQKGLEFSLPNSNFEEVSSSEHTVSSLAASPNIAEMDGKSSEKGNLLGFEMPPIAFFKKSRPDEILEESEPKNSPQNESNSLFDITRIPSWRPYGPNDVDVRLDSVVCKEGAFSLKISSQRSVGGISSFPFKAPATGRLCVQFSLGVRSNTSRVPLTICLRGLLGNQLFSHPIPLESIIQEKIQHQKTDELDKIIWIDHAVLFDRLPLDGLKNTTLNFELDGQGEVWIDKIQLYKLAFSKSEQNELMKILSTAEYRISNDRITDIIFLLDSYWARLLKEQIPDVSEQLLTRSIPYEKKGQGSNAQEPDNNNNNKNNRPEPKKEVTSKWWKFW